MPSVRACGRTLIGGRDSDEMHDVGGTSGLSAFLVLVCRLRAATAYTNPVAVSTQRVQSMVGTIA